MRLFEVVVLVFGFCLVFIKAESETGTNTLKDDEEPFVKEELDSTATEDWSSNLQEDPNESEEEEPKKVAMEDPKELDVPSFLRRRRVFLPVRVPTNFRVMPKFFRMRYYYCFRRRVQVPGLRQKFLGWRRLNQSGYVVIRNWLYFFWKCKPRPVPQPRPTPTPTPSRAPSSRISA